MRTRVRWIICALLFFATTINHIDRAVLGVLKPELERELGWTQVDYGWIVTGFQIAYALGYAGAGKLFDHIGVRLGYLLSVSLWSVAAMAHAVVRSVFGFCVARGGLGLAGGVPRDGGDRVRVGVAVGGLLPVAAPAGTADTPGPSGSERRAWSRTSPGSG